MRLQYLCIMMHYDIELVFLVKMFELNLFIVATTTIARLGLKSGKMQIFAKYLKLKLSKT